MSVNLRSPVRQVVAVSVAILVSIALGITAWLASRQADRLDVERTELRLAQTELRKARSELETSAKAAEEQTRELKDSLQQSLQHENDQRTRAVRMRRLGNGMIAAAPIKTAMTEYFYTEGKWPESDRDFGGIPEGPRSEGAQSIAVMPGGKIRLRFVDEAGKAEIVFLTATESAGNRVTWHCTTQDISDIAQLLPDCSYRPR